MAIRRISSTRAISAVKAETDTYAEAAAFAPQVDAGDMILVNGITLFVKTSSGTLVPVAGQGGGVVKVTGAAPTVNDDISLGYVVGSLWYDTTVTTGDFLYVCEDNTDGAAVWRKSSAYT